jgi:multidrug efflux system membrane fusion protein
MAQQDSRDISPHGEDLGQSFEAHNGNIGSAFEEKNASPELVIEKRSHTTMWVILIIVIVLAALLVYYLTSPKTAPGAPPGGGRGQNGPAAITIGKSTVGNINMYVDALGTVTPVSTVTLYSQITGVVQAVHYREGQIVHKGDPLIDVDPRPYEATLVQAEGTLIRDEGLLEEARMDLARYRAAWARNAIQKQELDDQEKLVVQDEGQVKSDQGAVDYDKVELSYCHIVSPIDGRVGLRLVDPGNTVFSGSSSTLVVVTQLQPITVVFDVSEDDLPEIQTELKSRKAMEVDAFDRGDETMLEAGKLLAVDNEIDTTTGTVKFRAAYPNRGNALFPNQFVNARLLVRTLTNATLVPTAAVQYNGTAAFLYMVNPNNTVTVQPITVVTSDVDVSAVTGVNPGETLATSGFDRLEDGAKVQIHERAQTHPAIRTGGPGSPSSKSRAPGAAKAQ